MPSPNPIRLPQPGDTYVVNRITTKSAVSPTVLGELITVGTIIEVHVYCPKTSFLNTNGTRLITEGLSYFCSAWKGYSQIPLKDCQLVSRVKLDCTCPSLLNGHHAGCPMISKP